MNINYIDKYLKYKNKYLLLKQNILKGGAKETNQKFKKFFNEMVNKKIDFIKVQLKAYLKYIDENGNYIEFDNIDKKLEKIFKNKLKKNFKKIITEGMLYDIQIIKYHYDSDLDIVNIYIKPEFKYIQYWNNNRKISCDMIEILNTYAKNIQYELEDGEQHWLDGDAIYIKKNEYDDKEYLLFAKLYSCTIYYDNKTKKIGYECDINSKDNFDNKCKIFDNI